MRQDCSHCSMFYLNGQDLCSDSLTRYCTGWLRNQGGGRRVYISIPNASIPTYINPDTSISRTSFSQIDCRKRDCFLQLESTPKGCIPDRPLSRGFGINAFGKLTWSGLMHLGNMYSGNRPVYFKLLQLCCL